LLLLLFTGLRWIEGASLRWEDVDFQSKVITIRAEIAKNKKEHCLPMSDFLEALLKKRHLERDSSEFVFPGRGACGHIVDSDHVFSGIANEAGCPFTLHDTVGLF
jgi:integrase